jgi:hypothetical protein
MNELNCGEYIANLLKFGYTLPLREYPPKSNLDNNKSALMKPDSVEDHLFMYESAGCIVATKEEPHLCLPLSMVWSNKERMVTDGSRSLNPFLWDCPVKLSKLD